MWICGRLLSCIDSRAPTPMVIDSFPSYCHKCGKYGHTARQCRRKKKSWTLLDTKLHIIPRRFTERRMERCQEQKSPPPKCGDPREFWGLCGKGNSINDPNHSFTRMCAPVNLLGGTSPCGSSPEISLTCTAKYPHFPNSRTTTREKGNDFYGWVIYVDGRIRSSDGDTKAGWCVVRFMKNILCGPVITTEAHLANAGSRIYSNNTSELSSIFEALSFPGSTARLHTIRALAFLMITSTQRVFFWCTVQ